MTDSARRVIIFFFIGWFCIYTPAARAQNATLAPDAANVLAYGADASGTRDSFPAIQKAIDDQCAKKYHDGVYLPAGLYRISRPLHLWCGLAVKGAGRTNTVISPFTAGSGGGGFAYGPLMIAAPAVAAGYCDKNSAAACAAQGVAVPTGVALLSGKGASLALDGTDNWRFNISRDTQAGWVNGLAAFTVEATIKFTGFPGVDASIITSGGKRLSAEGNQSYTSAFSLELAGGNTFKATLNVNGKSHVLYGGTVAAGNQYHVALSYDGVAIRFFVNGNQMASAVAGGPITQPLEEDVTVGAAILNWPDGDTFLPMPKNALLDGVRLSKTSRYKANFTPPAEKPKLDADTLFILNFEDQRDLLTSMITPAGRGWLVMRRSALAGLPAGSGFIPISAAEVSDAGFATENASGPFAADCVNCLWNRIWVTGAAPTGLEAWENCDGDSFSELITQVDYPGSSIGALSTSAARAQHWDHPKFQGSKYSFVHANGSALLTQPTFVQEGDTVIEALFKGAGGDDTVTLSLPEFIAEHPSPVFSANLIVDGVSGFTSTGGDYHFLSSPAVWLDGGGSATFIGSRFATSNAVPSIFHILNSPASPVVLVNPLQTHTPAASWSDNPAQVIVLGESGAKTPPK